MKRFATFLLGLIATAAWLGLAVWGTGGFSVFFSEPVRTALVAVTALLLAASAFSQGNLSSGQEEDRGNRWVLPIFFALGLLDGWLPAYSERMGLLTLGGEDMRWLGVALFAVGGTLRLWPVFVLGRRFSGLVAIQKNHQLVTDGLYRHIRNPSYLGLLVMVLGWGLAFRSLLGVVLAVSFIPILVGRMRSEERLLAEHFGAEYDAYRARTWRLLPHIY
jgi:protein-S-isoprenylcysteine O-methyltransferase Ste14